MAINIVNYKSASTTEFDELCRKKMSLKRKAHEKLRE